MDMISVWDDGYSSFPIPAVTNSSGNMLGWEQQDFHYTNAYATVDIM